MAPLVLLVALFVVLSGLGYAHVPFAFGWWTSLRVALAGMFLLTASAHWGKRRPDLVRMVPPMFPRPDLLVTATGILEILGAAGLMWHGTAGWAALGLWFMLLAVFPANIYAARMRMSIAGRPVPSLIPRMLIQIVFLVSTMAVFLADKR